MLLPWSYLAEAQQPPKLPQLGILTFDVPRSEPFLEVFFQELRRLGYVEGQNIAFEFRSAEGRVDRLPDLAAELVRLNVNVILASATGAALAAKNATSKIPIVFTAVSYPVGSGLVASLARPGGNITGLTNLTTDLSAKRLELLKEAFPNVSPVAVLSNPKDPISGPILQEVETAARALAVKLQLFEVGDPKEFDSALSGMTRARAGTDEPDVSQAESKNSRHCGKAPAADHVLGDGVRGGWRTDVLWDQRPGSVPPRRHIRRQDPQRHEAR
jgi:putative ABC transport system substrate-binding protein